MNEENIDPKAPQEKLPEKKAMMSNKSCLIMTILIILFLVSAGGLFYFKLGLGYDLTSLKNFLPEKGVKTVTTGSEKSTSSEYQQFVGSWDTGCLVPNPSDTYAEKHEFKFESDGTATHWRWMGASCEAMTKEDPQIYEVSLKGSDKIDLIDKASGATAVWDIFSIEGDTLYFGHGFNNGSSTSTNSGGSEDDRFNGLNKFLGYKKVL